MVWMLAPPLVILTKLAEVTNNPPVFVFTDKLHMTSPLLFASWADVKIVTLEGLKLLGNIQIGGGGEGDLPAWQATLLFNLRVALVWVLGARLPRYAVQMSLLILAVAMAIQPHVAILLVAASLI